MVHVFLRRENVDDGVEMVQNANGTSFSTVENKKHIEKGGHSIFKVPQSLKNLELDAYVPHVVSIGPYHRNEGHLKEMETYKWILLEHVLNRAEMPFKTLKEKMSKFEKDTRKHYDQYFEGIEDFVDMMLLDSCFILELFSVDVHGWTKYQHKSDPSSRLNMKGFMPFIRRDLLMLENQLPLFLLEEMFALLDWKEKTPNESIHSLAINFFKKLIPGISINQPKHPENTPLSPHPENRLPPSPHPENRPLPPPENRPPPHPENRLPPPPYPANRLPPPPENRPPPPPHQENRPPPPPPPHRENRLPPPPSHPEIRLSPPPPPSHPEIKPSPPPHQENGPPTYLHLLDIVHQSLKPSSQDDDKSEHWICTHGNCLISYPISLPCFSSTICAQDSEPDKVSSPSSSSSSSSSDPPEPSSQDDDKTEHWICIHGNCLISYPISLPCFSSTICAQDSEPDKVSSPSDPPEIVMHSVTCLRSMGIEFEEYKNWKKFTDIKYEHKGGKLLIPRLHINGSTKSIFLNLMVFEQGSPYCSRYITSYTSFMDGLIDSPKDAHHLIEKRIISHELGSEDDVSTLFNNLRREIYFELVPNDYYLSDVSQKLNEHYQQKWRSWIATLKHEYLKDPWKTVSLFAAALLIILTALQTAYTMVGYHSPRP